MECASEAGKDPEVMVVSESAGTSVTSVAGASGSVTVPNVRGIGDGGDITLTPIHVQ